MESVELKLRGIDSSVFAVNYTRKIVDMLHYPELSLEVQAGKTSDDVSRLVESLGYQVTARKSIEDWIWLKAVKASSSQLHLMPQLKILQYPNQLEMFPVKAIVMDLLPLTCRVVRDHLQLTGNWKLQIQGQMLHMLQSHKAC